MNLRHNGDVERRRKNMYEYIRIKGTIKKKEMSRVSSKKTENGKRFDIRLAAIVMAELSVG